MVSKKFTEPENLYYSAIEVASMLGVSRTKGYELVKQMNEELAQKNYIIISGKIPRRYLEEKIYGMAN